MKKILTIFFILFSIQASAEEIYFGGFSFIGNDDQSSRYPYAAELSSKESLLLNEKLTESLKLFNRADLTIKTDKTKLSDGSKKMITFSLSDEKIERLKEKDGIYSFYKVLAQILIFDFDSKKIIFNYPVAIQYQDFTQDIPSSDDDKKIFRQIYLDLNFESNIFKHWTNQLMEIKIKEPGALNIKVGKVELSSDVKEQLPDYLKINNIFEIQTAQRFEFQLATNQSASMLPYTIGKTGNKKMLNARFVDGISYDLEIPESDYDLNILVREFKKIKIDEDNFDGYVFGAFVTMELIEPLSNKKYLESKFNIKNKLMFPKNEKYEILNEWDIYQRTQDLLFSNLTKQISNRNKDELKKITNTKNIEEQFKKFEEILSKCK